MRRRPGRWGRARGGSGRLLERLAELGGLTLRDLRAVQVPGGPPQGIELGGGRREGGGPVAVVASVRDGLDLIGWGEVAARLARDQGRPEEVVIAAPFLGDATRRAARRASRAGRRYCLVVAPGLADPKADLLLRESFPREGDPLLLGGGSGSVLGRLLQVLSGAAAVASCGELRRCLGVYLLFMRGICVMRVSPEGAGAVAVSFLAPESRLIHVTGSNFSRWGVELHEAVVQLARDPRLLEGTAASRDQRIDRSAAAARVRVTARWLPWNPDGVDPVEWCGVAADGRPVLGLIRDSLALADAPGLVAALHLLEEERELWSPGSHGAPRLWISADRLEPGLGEFLGDLAVEFEVVPLTPVETEGPQEAEHRSRRRPRRRRRARSEAGAPPAAGMAEDARSGSEEGPRDQGPEEGDAGGALVEIGPARGEESPEQSSERERPQLQREDAASESGAGEPLPAEERSARAVDRQPERSPVLEPGGGDDSTERPLEEESAGPPGEEESADPVEIEIAATLAEEPEEVEESEGEPVEAEPPLRRSARAAIVVHRDPESILAALILARDRRSIVSFRVIEQDGLMDFFRGPATDLAENVDLLLVGLTAQPTPVEVIQSAEIFRGRLQWFDHHSWPIEDVEHLRDAIGRDAIRFLPGASSPLAAVSGATERRSRFTDKLVDLAGRRLSENDMIKWGYRVVALVDRLAGESGDRRDAITPILSGRPAELPEAERVFAEESAWLEAHAPRVVHFGEYQMTVLRVPRALDAAEVGRRSRLATGARLSLTSREDDDLAVLGCNDEKRHINVMGLVEHISARIPWVEAAPGGDHAGRIRIEGLLGHPERIDALVGEIVRHRSILYG